MATCGRAKRVLLKAEVRQQTGSKDAAKVRKSGRLPAVLYGHKEEPVAVSLDTHKLIEGLHAGRRLVDVQLVRLSARGRLTAGTPDGEKKAQKAVIKDLQFDYLGKQIIHVDLMRVSVGEMIKVQAPIELKGEAKGTHEGGIVEEHTDHLEIECKAGDIPEAVVVSVKELGVGDALHAGDIELPEGVKLVSDPETLLVTCSLVSVAKSTEELEEEIPAAPEVIGEAESEEEGTAEKEAEKRKT